MMLLCHQRVQWYLHRIRFEGKIEVREKLKREKGALQEGAELCQAQPVKHKVFGSNGAIFFWFDLLMVEVLNCLIVE